LTLGDLHIQCYLVSIGRSFRVLVDAAGYALQFDVFGRAIANPPGYAKWGWAWPVFAVLRKLARRAIRNSIRNGDPVTNFAAPRQRFLGIDVAVRPLTLMSPRVLADRNVRIIEDDIVSNKPEGSFHVVRAANILNRDYFDEPTLLNIVKNLRRRLKPGGLLAVVTTEHDICSSRGSFVDSSDAKNHGTVFMLRRGKLEVVDRIGNGSRIEGLVLSTNAASDAKPALEAATR
jgi:hypothetical protein